jgi:hydroxyacylglutathione hydrolase
METETFVTYGLGDNSYLIASGGEAAVVDPQRDAWRFLAAAEARGWKIRYVLETHVHNDYVTGALEIREASGSRLVLPGDGGYQFAHEPAAEGTTVALGDIELVARHTPGHTPEHISWEARGDGSPHAVFTGGSLLVGSTGRSDLLGEEMAEELTRAQYRTAQRLASLPDEVQVLPTHGAGSFCVGDMPSTARTSTIGEERRQNPALLAADEDAFLRQQLANATRYPAYYRYMAALNRAGPPMLGRLPRPVVLSVDDLERRAHLGTHVIDGRERTAFAAAHVPGSINVELNEAFGSYVGWLVPLGEPIALVLPDPLAESIEEAMLQLLRIGYEKIEGVLAGGIDAWQDAGRAVRSYPTASMKELHGVRVEAGREVAILDVRQPMEWRDDGELPGSARIFAPDLPGRIGELPANGEYWVVCTTGHRAAMAASILDRAGVPVRLVSRGGTVGWIERFQGAAAPGGAGRD